MNLAMILKYWKYGVIGILVIALFADFSIQSYRIGRLRLKNDQLALEKQKTEQQLTECQQANVAGRLTIEALRDEVETAHGLCGNRLKIKNSIIDRLRIINNLQSTREVKHESNSGGNDLLFDALNGLFDTPSEERTGTDRVHQTADPGTSEKADTPSR